MGTAYREACALGPDAVAGSTDDDSLVDVAGTNKTESEGQSLIHGLTTILRPYLEST